MAQPPRYIREKIFSEDQGNETDHPALNNELDRISNSINAIEDNLAILQADDGKLRPNVVTPDSVSEELVMHIVTEANADAASQMSTAIATVQQESQAAINEVTAHVATAQQAAANAQAAATTSGESAAAAMEMATQASTKADQAVTDSAAATATANDAFTQSSTALGNSETALSQSTTAVNDSSNALSLATSASNLATTADGNATDALAKSEQALTDSASALTQSTQALTDSETALTQSSTALGNSETALTQSTTAVNDSATALERATSASNLATTADGNATDALTKATSASEASQQATADSTEALTKATQASTDASTALTQSSQALTDSATALTQSTTAVNDSATALEKATSAETASQQAVTDSATAISSANQALAETSAIDTKVSDAVTEALVGVEIPGLTSATITAALGYTPYDGETNSLGFASAEGIVTAVDEAVSPFEERIGTVETDITALEGRVGTAESDIDALEGRAATAETNITNVTTRVTTLEEGGGTLGSRLTTAESDIDALEGRATTTETNITNVTTRVTTLEEGGGTLGSRLTTAESDIDALEGRVGTTETNITDVTARVVALEEGGSGSGFARTIAKNYRGTIFKKTGPNSIAVKADTYLSIGGVTYHFAEDTPVSPPSFHQAGSSYCVWLRPDGTLSASYDAYRASGDAVAPVEGSIKIGGYFYSAIEEGTTLESGSFNTAEDDYGSMIWTQDDLDALIGIIAHSLWDLNWRPNCPIKELRGMTCYFGQFWYDIFLSLGLATGHASSAYRVQPQTRANLNKVIDFARSRGKRLLRASEFMKCAYGVTEGQAIGASHSNITNGIFQKTLWEPGYTSLTGGAQMTGNMWTLCDEPTGYQGSSWVGSNDNGWTNGVAWMCCAGGDFSAGTYAGSKCVSWNNKSNAEVSSIGFRLAADHLEL